ncbi:MAG: glucuronate isomerase [Paracoccaceae bacterium]
MSKPLRPRRPAGHLVAELSRRPPRQRAFFASMGATSTDHGHPTAHTENLDPAAAEALYDTVMSGAADAAAREAFRGQMLTEMAKLSLEDGLVMQFHPGSYRNHSGPVLGRHGRDKGFDIPTRTDYVRALKPLLDAVGEGPELTVILFTLDESAYARELAPLAGVYPALKLGPAWWFRQPEGCAVTAK